MEHLCKCGKLNTFCLTHGTDKIDSQGQKPIRMLNTKPLKKKHAKLQIHKKARQKKNSKTTKGEPI